MVIAVAVANAVAITIDVTIAVAVAVAIAIAVTVAFIIAVVVAVALAIAIADCENILCGYIYDGDLVFVILKGIYGFKFPKRFLEISSRDLTSSLLLFLFS